MTNITLRCLIGVLSCCVVTQAANVDRIGNRLTYLDDFTNPYFVGRDFPKLVTPQWVGDPQVELVVTLGIDDMRHNTADYERHLRPILNRLQEIDGRAPVSIMTCDVDANDPQLQTWLREGLNIDAHTTDHPCPCLQNGDFAKAKQTYDRCVDQIAAIPGNTPTAFRFPCMDSLNTPSPRGFAEILSKTTSQGKFLQISSSVCVLLTPDDPALPRDLIFEKPGQERFRKYLPFRNFVNVVHDYPYPFVIGKLLWEFPCAVPDDWQGQHLQGAANPQTAHDFQAYAAAARIKMGTANFVFHPNQWLGSELMTQVVDAIDRQHGKQVLFLNFRECAERLKTHLLSGQSIRDSQGGDNGVRLLDVNHDGYLDVVIGNEQLQATRIWEPAARRWRDGSFPTKLVKLAANGQHEDQGVRFGILQQSGMASLLITSGESPEIWHFNASTWERDEVLSQGLAPFAALLKPTAGIDRGVRLRDCDGDGYCELIISNAQENRVLAWSPAQRSWIATEVRIPETLVDSQGRDHGVRWVDLNADQHDDVLVSNDKGYSVHLFTDLQQGWSRTVRSGKPNDADAIPRIASHGMNMGTWFAEDHLWVQNEFTNHLPDGIDKVSFDELLGKSSVGPLEPAAAQNSFRLPAGLQLELVAAEPLVQDPVAIDWGPDGRLWVVEMGDYPMGTDGQGGAGGRVRYLDDTDQDGKYDRSTLFLEGLHFPSGIMAWQSGVLISAAPHILYAEDTDHDGRAETQRVLYTGFTEGNQQHRVHGFSRSLENWIYVSNGHSGGKIQSAATGKSLEIRGRDLRIDPRTGDLETVAGETQHSRCQDDAGNWFGGANNSVGWHYVLADEQLKRNPWGRYPSWQHPLSTEELIYPSGKRLMHWEGYSAPPPGQPESASAVCGYTFYRDTLLGAEFAGNFFLCDPTNNAVQRRRLQPQGATFTSLRLPAAHDRDFLTSVDPWFRPTQARTGPDGALWIVDMYRMVIEHPEWISNLLEAQIDVRSGCDRGRIYRISAVGQPLRAIPRLDQLEPDQLVAQLASDNGPTRDLAQQMLIDKLRTQPDPATLSLLRKVVQANDWEIARLHALCTLDGAQQIDTITLTTALHDRHPHVRRHAYRIAAAIAAESDRSNKSLVLPSERQALGQHFVDQAMQESDPQARLEAAYGLAAWPAETSAATLWKLWQSDTADPYLVAAVVSSIHSGNLAALTRLAIESQSQDELAELLRIAIKSSNHEALSATMAYLQQQVSQDEQHVEATLPVLAILLADQSSHDQTFQAMLREQDPLLTRVTAWARDLLTNQPDCSEAQRRQAMNVLGHRPADHPLDIAALRSQLVTQTPVDLQLMAIAKLARSKEPDATAALLDYWNSATPRVRRAIGEGLLQSPSQARVWLEAFQSGTIPPNSIDARHRQHLLQHADQSLQSQAVQIWGAAGADQRREVLDRYRSALKLHADSTHGQQLFQKHCTTCHQLAGVGQVVGSNLAELQHKSPAALMESILDPNRAVEDRFLEYAIVTETGQVWHGILAEETSSSITLRSQDGKQQHILRDEIAEIKNLGRSMMPEGLEKDLSPQDLSDLIAYLQLQRAPPKTVPGNQPTLVKSTGDTLRLDAEQCSIYGPTLLYEPGYKNLGFWSQLDDKAVWTLETSHAGNYEVVLEYACHVHSAGTLLTMEVGAQALSAPVPSTQSWDEYREWKLGVVYLEGGIHTLSIYPAEKPVNCLIDLRRVRLQKTPD